MAAERDTIPFHPEISQILRTINRIVDTDREKQVFLHDLIGNSSDALDKIRLDRLKGKSKLDGDQLFICLVANKSSNTLTIIDNGVGMTKSNLVKLGTITKPSTRTLRAYLLSDTSMHPFLWQIPSLGFYTAFFVAKRVIVTSKSKNGEQYVWEAEAGCGSFSVRRDTTSENLGRGTKVTLYLKDDQSVYLDETLLKDLLKKHSKFINYQISFKNTEQNPSGYKISVIHEKPIWTRELENISKEEYAICYKSLINGVEEVPLAVKHFSYVVSFLEEKKMNGVFVEFKSILFVPRQVHQDVRLVDILNVRLYEELIPHYLSFVRGIVDSDDVPLKITRVMLHRNKIHEVIRENLVNKCFELFFEIAENAEDYRMFYQAFSNNLKLGMLEDSQNRTKIVQLLRYRSTESGDELTSLKDYVSRMKKGQRAIYYIARENNTTAVENSPIMEDLKKRGCEVLFMVDASDDDVISQLKEFEGKKLEEVKLLIGPVDFKSTLTEEEKKHFEKWLKGGPEIRTKVFNMDDDFSCCI